MGRTATEADIHRLAAALPHVTVSDGDLPTFLVGDKAFITFRSPRRDAADPVTKVPYNDVVIIWVPDEDDKRALIQDPSNPFFTTDHFAGHKSVLVRLSELSRLDADLLGEVIEDAWLSRASATMREEYLRRLPQE